MSTAPENSRNNFPKRRAQSVSFRGLSAFTNNLEKFFFSEISIRNIATNDNQVRLIIDLTCDLNLIEMIMHSYKGTWGTFSECKYPFAHELAILEQYNNISFDVEEFTINLKDTSIIINKIYEQSISTHLDCVIRNLEKHYVQLTKGNVEIPYEIFVAVFEDDILTPELVSNQTKKTHNYASYWALYFESEQDAVIYDLKNNRFIYEDLHMINE
ncbi:hypothetical protein HPE56_01810 [Maribacter sp. ANRC-HE7]|uniref:Uncharacterized protein n=1 Tax=Maribacter aquimaris TaxID=2737171 RepID=A0ABR7UW33_9FLAO|nr:hypothetical protein [Maribacter aquimaris]MBD0776513.1 hypothetical protein [Maribacter aquimaris]